MGQFKEAASRIPGGRRLCCVCAVSHTSLTSLIEAQVRKDTVPTCTPQKPFAKRGDKGGKVTRFRASWELMPRATAGLVDRLIRLLGT